MAQIRKVLNVTIPNPKVKLSAKEMLIAISGIDPYLCPKCKKGRMLVVKIIPSTRGSPPRDFVKNEMMKRLENMNSVYQ